MKKILLVAGLLLLMLFAAACQPQQEEAPAAEVIEEVVAETAQQEAAHQETAPEAAAPEETAAADEKPGFAHISTMDIYGNEADGSIFTEYELTMVNIWATYCNPCIMEMPYLGEMAAEMPEGTQLVGLVTDVLNKDSLDLARTIVETTEANYTHLLPDEILFDYVYDNVTGVPTTVFIDAEGNLIGKQLIGAYPRLVYEEELARRLEEVRAAETEVAAP